MSRTFETLQTRAKSRKKSPPAESKAQPNNSVQSTQEDLDILKEAREWLTTVGLAETQIREERAKCRKFRSLDQWDPTIKTARGARPSLVMDHTGQFIDQVVNDWRRNRMGIQVSPGDEDADDETATTIDGLIREIEYRSKAHVAYDRAFDQMTGENQGYTRITTKRRPGSFRKDIYIKHIQNPDCVYFDPFCVETDYSDAMRCLVVDKLGKKQYHQEWGAKAPEIDFAPYSKNSDYAGWISADTITVAEWWVVKEVPRKIQKLNKPIGVVRDNQAVVTDVVYSDEWDPKDPLMDGVEIKTYPATGERMEEDEPKREVWQYLINGVQILDKTLWEGSYIPIIPWNGKELFIDGKKRLYALISRVLDAQQALNYSISSTVSAVALTPINPLVGYVGQDKTNQKQIAESNRVPYAFIGFDLIYDDKGNLLPLPTRQNTEPEIQSTSYLSQQLIQFMKAGVGMYGASLGDREGKARSGVAEKALQQEGDNATFDFLDNGARAVELTGCQIVDLIPKIYSAAELLQIRDAQNKVMSRAVNQDIRTLRNVPEGQKTSLYLTKGKYNVAVSAAPSHETLRKEGEERLLAMMELAEPADRRKMMLTSMRLSNNFALQSVAKDLDPPKDQQDPKQLQAQLADAMKMLDLLTKTNGELQDKIDSKQVEADNKKEIEAMRLSFEEFKTILDNATKRMLAHEQMSSQEHLKGLDVAAAQDKAKLDVQIAESAQASSQQHEREMAEASAKQAAAKEPKA